MSSSSSSATFSSTFSSLFFSPAVLSPSFPKEMKYVAAYLLAVVGGNHNPSASDLKAIISAAGDDAHLDEDRLSKVVAELEGKDVADVIAKGKAKLSSAPVASSSGSPSAAAAPSAASSAAAPPKAEEKKKEEKVEEKVAEEEDEDMGLGLFD